MVWFFAEEEGSELILKPDPAQGRKKEEVNAWLIINIFGILTQKTCPPFFLMVLDRGQE